MTADKRDSIRHQASIPVIVHSVLQAHEAVLADVSESGAKMSGTPIEKGTTIWFDHEGVTFYGKVMWTEHDRYGVMLTSGNGRALVRSVSPGTPFASSNPAPIAPRAGSLPAAASRPTFGRRAAA